MAEAEAKTTLLVVVVVPAQLEATQPTASEVDLVVLEQPLA
jgi:hypothetical protein